MAGFKTGLTLSLEGASWMVALRDRYVDYYYVRNRGMSADDLCKDVTGYADPCPTTGAANFKPFIMMTLCCLIIFWFMN